jgi:hypothetical protein
MGHTHVQPPMACLPRSRSAPLLCLLVAVASSAVGCSSESGRDREGETPPAPLPPLVFAPDTSKFEVAWKPAAKVVEGASDLLLDESEVDGVFTYRFKPDAAAIASLAPDDIAVLGGIAYRRVVSVVAQPDAVVLTTKRTKLTDAIASGTIAWKKMFDFGQPSTISKASFGLEGGTLRPLDITTGISYEGQLKGFDISIALRPSNGRLDISLAASKTIGGRKILALTGEGFIERFQSDGEIVLGESGLVDFRYGSNQVRGEMKIKAAATDAGISQDLMNIPLRIQIPVQVGPVPVIVKLGANLNVTAELSAQPASAQAEVTLAFTSDSGVHASGTSLSPTGSISGESLTVVGGGSASAVAAGMTVCLEAPRIEMAFLGETASVGLTQNNCASTVYTFDPSCNQVNASIVGKGLAQLGFLGVTLASGEVELYTKRESRSVGNCEGRP